ncbi:MAG: quinol oxidase [Deltaproteobacteria bacterium]|nr:quinol oxidase [Deltaproteobacteria bacterium]
MKLAVAIAVSVLLSGAGYAAEQKEFRAVLDQTGVQRAEIKGGSFYFEPNRLVVKVGVPVELTLTKEPGILPHDFVLEAPEAGISVKEPLETEPKVVRFTPTKTGLFTFYCSKKPPLLKSHRDRGMEGALEVVD